MTARPVAVLVLVGVSCASPTAPTGAFVDHAVELANKYAECMGIGPVRVRFDVDSRETPHCGAFPGGSLIVCKGPIPFENPAGIMAHEVCHLAGHGSEQDAEVCAFFLQTDCR